MSSAKKVATDRYASSSEIETAANLFAGIPGRRVRAEVIRMLKALSNQPGAIKQKPSKRRKV